MPEWKDSLNLPRTEFPMKASLQTAEPRIIAHWESTDLYGRIRVLRKGATKFVLHDGPPYANGKIHIGHALNKVLKDFVVRSRTMAGFDAPYVPGWDCHGLPIELQVDRELGSKKRTLSVGDFRRECQKYANKYVDLMKEEFKRLGILGLWDDPYLTMNYAYQAAIVRSLGTFVKKNIVYKGKKPVHWCIRCRTALAEAEVEYDDHKSQSIFVEFSLNSESTQKLYRKNPVLKGKAISALIWTTTPWTIPSNLALAFHPNFDYAVFDLGEKAVLIAEPLAKRVSETTARQLDTPLAQFKGNELENLVFEHPLYARDSISVLAEYVTLEQGTGIVHTAPGHGTDDFNTGLRYKLDIYAPVGPSGKYTEDVELFAGLKIFDANPIIIEELSAREKLWHQDIIEHSYPHCWRCHRPVIFLATSQWFIAMDRNNLREKSFDAVSKVKWFPRWGEERIHGMLTSRPDWCISRQRSWGVPIPALQCLTCGESFVTEAIVERAASLFEKHGADVWYEGDMKDFVPNNFRCKTCDSTQFQREQDILDVWFDSGSSHEAVQINHPEIGWPVNLYLEGSDQYRGWFQSSLLVGLGTREEAPYQQVITHGFVVDELGRKMSKSLGNVVAPETIIKQSGSEVLRLWVAMVDYREEIRIGKEILARVIEAYRKIRNTLRILVANLYDFNPNTDTVDITALPEIDRYILSVYGETAVNTITAYDQYEFQSISHSITRFLTVDLSSFYIDVSKDVLYTFGAHSHERRSAQTAMYIIADGLTRLLAPLLPVTMEELWKHLPGTREESVHLADFPNDLKTLLDSDLRQKWIRLLAIRDTVNGKLEDLRKKKIVGTSLEADVVLHAAGTTADLLQPYQNTIPSLLITSEATVISTTDPDEISDLFKNGDWTEENGGLKVEVTSATGVKCPRCWRYVAELSTDHLQGVCHRCVNALENSANIPQNN
tara:strand:- start:2426 stop:5266 length:2841 start_codon:yes stop_codon:yes gene_type:complete